MVAEDRHLPVIAVVVTVVEAVIVVVIVVVIVAAAAVIVVVIVAVIVAAAAVADLVCPAIQNIEVVLILLNMSLGLSSHGCFYQLPSFMNLLDLIAFCNSGCSWATFFGFLARFKG